MFLFSFCFVFRFVFVGLGGPGGGLGGPGGGFRTGKSSGKPLLLPVLKKPPPGPPKTPPGPPKPTKTIRTTKQQLNKNTVELGPRFIRAPKTTS